MKRILVSVYSIVLIITLINIFSYRSLYKNQLNYIITLLDRQVQLVGLSVDNANNNFLSDLNQILFDENLLQFFVNQTDKHAAIERFKLFFYKYDSFIVGIRLYDNMSNEFTLKRDPDTGRWLEQSFMLHNQGEIVNREMLVEISKKFEYYLPLIDNNVAVGNVVVTIDYQQYFSTLFMAFNMKDYQWQWVLSDSGNIIFDNVNIPIKYNQLDRIVNGIQEGTVEHLVHSALIDGENRNIISTYYSTQLVQRDLGIVFSAPTDYFQKYIFKNSLLIIITSFLLAMVIIMILLRRIKAQDKTILQLDASEKLLFNLIDKLPVGIIIHNKNREIIKANSIAVKQYSYESESEMSGKIFPEISLEDDLQEPNPDQFIVIKKEIGETVLYRNSLPITFKGEEARLEILFDDSEWKNEAKPDTSLQSEFFARMSHEIRTPLNGIIGMTDMLGRHKFAGKIAEIVALLRQSSEILLKIVNDIFDFSKIESGNIILDEVPFNLRNELNYCTEQAKKSVAEGVKFYCSIDDYVPDNIIGDQFRLRQVLINLINHSIANTNEGKIHLDCKLKYIKHGDIALVVTLSDTGVLLDKASINKVFGEYLHLDVNNIKTGDNTVFGAIVAKKLIELMGGELHVESPAGLVENRGLKITFSIPVFTGNQSKNLNTINIRTFESVKALAIIGPHSRDEETISDLHKIGVNLKVTTYQKFTISQIKNNLNFPNERYNLILIFDTDDLNGFEVASNIWENNLSGSFCLFLITKKDKKGNYPKCVTMGIDQYMIKPFEITELLQAIKTFFPGIIGKPALPKSIDKSDVKILIAEDNLMNQKIMGSMLNSLGYNFETADDGYEAYKKIEEQKYDLIIIDMIMPKMDGFELSEHIIRLYEDALIIAISANSDPAMIEKSKLVGIKEFLPKPIRIEELKRVLIKYFSK